MPTSYPADPQMPESQHAPSDENPEKVRLRRQLELDSAKSARERNKMGQFATPPSLAKSILEYARMLSSSGGEIRFLDPAFGTGAFYGALLSTFPPYRITSAVGYEIDSEYEHAAEEVWRSTRLRLQLADFTRVSPPREGRATLVICNPPYVRHHHLTLKTKTRLQRATKRLLGLSVSGLTGLYCYFVFLAHPWMEEGALAGWLIPSEFMSTNYGKSLREYLLDHVTLLRIHRFDPHRVQFDDALVSSSVVWFRNTRPPPGHVVEFAYSGTLSKPRIVRGVPASVLRGTQKWAVFPQARTGTPTTRGQTVMSELFWIKRGVATGANSFFIMTERQARETRIPERFLIPIVPSPRHLQTDEISADDEGYPKGIPLKYLLSCDLSWDDVKQNQPALSRYFEEGVKRGISRRYLSTHRIPWYSQERRPTAPILCTYMGRRKGGASPFRFILNHSNATAPNVYLMLYPKPALSAALKADTQLLRTIWKALNALPATALVNQGRTYGGGLNKLEPKELGAVTIADYDRMRRQK